jgi:hypothetical protein
VAALRSQVQVIASIAALGMVVAVVSVLYLSIFSKVSQFRILEVSPGVYNVLNSRLTWRACDLAQAIMNNTGISYVSVNITVTDLISGSTLGQDYCEVKTPQAGSNYRVYTYARETRDGVLYFYVIKVAS